MLITWNWKTIDLEVVVTSSVFRLLFPCKLKDEYVCVFIFDFVCSGKPDFDGLYIKLWEFHRIYKIQAQRKMETDTQMQAFIRFNRTHWNGWVFDLSSSRIYFKRNKQKWKFYREKFTAAFCHKDFCCIYGNFDKKKKTHTHTPISITKRKE